MMGARILANGFLGLMGLVLAAQACRADTVLYSTGFEASDGFTNGVRLDEQNGWRSFGSGSNAVVSGFFPGQGQQAYLGFPAKDPRQGGVEVWKPINVNPLTNGGPLVTFSTLMSIAASTNGQADYFDWIVYNTEGTRLFTLDFDNYSGEISYALDAGGTFVPTGIVFSNQVPYQLQVTMDFAHNRWGATFGGAVAVDGQPMTTTNALLNLGDVDAAWVMFDTNAPGNNFMVFDNYRITAGPAPPPPPMVPVVYSTGFEYSEGYTNVLSLDQQKGWRSFGSGSNGIVSDVFVGLGQQAYVGYPAKDPSRAGVEVWPPLNYDPLAAKHPLVTFSVLMGITASTNGQADYFDWSVYNTNSSRLFTLEFDNYNLGISYQLDGTNKFVPTRSSYSDNVAYLLSIQMDFSQNRWSASLGGALLVTNLPMTTTNAPLTLGDVDAVWSLYDTNAPGNNYMVFDNYKVTAQGATAPRPSLQFLQRKPDGSAVVQLTGQPSASFAIEASTNLLNWIPLTTNTTTGGRFDFQDVGATKLPYRFYRGRSVP